MSGRTFRYFRFILEALNNCVEDIAGTRGSGCAQGSHGRSWVESLGEKGMEHGTLFV